MVKIAAALFGIAAVACVDLSSPKNAPASISLLQLPEFFVVRGDVMRDSLGNPTAPSVITYDGSGAVVTGFTPFVFVTDSQPVITVNSTGILVAAQKTGTAHVIGQIGNVQTPAAIVYVTVPPTTLVKNVVGSDTLQLTIGVDSASSLGGFALPAIVRGGAGGQLDTAVGGAIVSYRIVSTPFASRSSSPTMYIGDDANNPSPRDTSDGAGNVSRKLIINSRLLADTALFFGHRLDSVTVEASMKYKGVNLAGSPLRFVVKVRGGLGL